MAKLKVNGELLQVEADPSTPLLWVLREQLGLTGTKYSCGIGICGSCTVHIDGAAVRACTLPVSEVNPNQEIVTIEGLSEKGDHPLQKAWREPGCALGVIARDMGHYQRLYRERILTLPHIADIEALMHVATVKAEETLPI